MEMVSPSPSLLQLSLLISLLWRLDSKWTVLRWYELNPQLLILAGGENKTRFTAYSVIKDINLKRS